MLGDRRRPHRAGGDSRSINRQSKHGQLGTNRADESIETALSTGCMEDREVYRDVKGRELVRGQCGETDTRAEAGGTHFLSFE